MSAGTYNIPDIEQGAAYTLGVTLGGGEWATVDFTTYNARAKIARVLGGSPVATFLVTDGTKAVGSYQMTLSLTATETAALMPSDGFVGRAQPNWGQWDLEVFTSGDADVKRVLQGTVKLSLQATI